LIKSTFSRRAIAIPRRETDLIEQLESLEITEGSVQSARRDLVKLQPGGTFGAGAHDDVAIAVALCLEHVAASIGMLQLPPMRECLRMANQPNFHASRCYMMNRGLGYYPADHDPSCSYCPGHIAVRQMYVGHLARGGQPYGSTWEFFRERVRENEFVQRFYQEAFAHRNAI
jgi:hypothetical protein